MAFKKFEEIEAWKLARELCKIVRILTEKGAFSKDWTLRYQIRSSSGSVMDCIAEGHGRGNNNEFKYFLGIAKGSCDETRSQGYRALDYEYISQIEFDELSSIANRTGAAIHGLIEYLNRTEIKGIRNKITDAPQKKSIIQDPNFPSEPPPGL